MSEDTVVSRSQMYKHEDIVDWLTSEGHISEDSTQAEVVAAAFAHRNEYRRTERYQTLVAAGDPTKAEREAAAAAAKAEKAAAKAEAKAARDAEKAAKAEAAAAAKAAKAEPAPAAPVKATKAAKKTASKGAKTEDDPFA